MKNSVSGQDIQRKFNAINKKEKDTLMRGP